MKKSLPQIIVIIAALIVGFWLVGLAFKLAGWLLNLLLPAAALVLIIAIVLSWRTKRPDAAAKPRQKKSEPLRISRDTSDTKKDPQN